MPFDQLQIILAQINPVVGDIQGNTRRIAHIWEREDAGADLVIFPELCVCAYPPEDLVLRPAFIKQVKSAIETLAQHSKSRQSVAVVSAPWEEGGKLYNSAICLAQGEILAVRHKVELPNYGVFDEKRLFTSGPLPEPVTVKGVKIGLMTCEDLWKPKVSRHLKEQGAECLISLNASPYDQHKQAQRYDIARARIDETGLPVVYLNQVGGQDELVFDGASFVMDAKGSLQQSLSAFDEEVSALVPGNVSAPLSKEETLYSALVLGLRDYVEKNGFSGVLLGLSGGIDSALSAVIAADALGAHRVECVMMPSRYTSQASLDDAAALANNLGVPYQTIPVEGPVEVFHEILPKDAPSIMFENIQSRTRGLILMALSNAGGKMVLSTGNKSEMAVGYATLYGDMCGGFNALKDLYKQQVYALSRWRNAQGEDALIPDNIITKVPTAELKENQTDQDSLPEYDVLDAILEGLIEDEASIEDIASQIKVPIEEVRRVANMLARAEYKRRQAPPGVKVTAKAFGKERRYPITSHFRES